MGFEPMTRCISCGEPFDVYTAPEHRVCEACWDDPGALLNNLRWRADMIVTNPFGERVWLKSIEGGVTDCCPVDAPCERHKGNFLPANGLASAKEAVKDE